MTGKLLIRSGYTELVDLGMRREGGASLAVNGRVAWTTSDGPRGPQPRHRAKDSILSPRVDEAVTTDVKVAVRNLPIDNDLLTAVPKERRQWITHLGVTGKLDVEGRVFPSQNAARPPTWNGWSAGSRTRGVDRHRGQRAGRRPRGRAAGDGLRPETHRTRRHAAPVRPHVRGDRRDAVLQLTPDRLALERVAGRRGEAELAVRGNIDWPHGEPRIVLDGTAAGLMLDAAAVRVAPRPPRGAAWDETQPQGTLDAEVHYDSVALDAARGATSLAAAGRSGAPRPTAPTSPPAFASSSSPASSRPR